MTRTPTHPPDHRGMWRRLLGRAHPDGGGDHDLFIWTVATRDVMCNGEFGGKVPGSERREQPSRPRERSTPGAANRVPFDELADFELLTDRALSMAAGLTEPYGYLLRQVADCFPAEDGPLYEQQHRGATYKTLAAVGHRVGLTKAQRGRFYRICEAIPLSQRHAGHILSRLKGEAA